MEKVKGLTSEEVAVRVAEGKVNGNQNVRTKSYGEIFRTNIFTFFNFLFLGLAVIMVFFVRTVEDLSNFGFMGVVIANMLIGIIQEVRAKQTIDKLSLITAPRATVMRDGQETEIALSDIVLDDIVILTAGNQICADGFVVEGSMEVNESLLTGEPDAIVKCVDDKVMSGSYVLSGKAEVQVEHIGAENYAAKISAGAKYLKKPSSQILRALNKIIKFMAVVIIPLGISLFCIKFFHQHGDLGATAKTVVGTLVGLIPSGLVALTSAVFCVSVIRLSRYKTLAQDLYCVETLARVDVLCLDKTGTITEGAMQVMDVVSENIDTNEFKQILKDVTSAIGDSNPTANAIAEYTSDLTAIRHASSIIPFSSARKWSGANFEGESFVVGAAEFIFSKVDKKMAEQCEVYAEQGNRVLTLAKSQNPIENNVLPKDLTFLGYVLISDKIRKEAPDTLKYFAEQGVTIKIISGDNPITVKSVAARAGLKNAESFIDMSTVADDQIVDIVDNYTIFGRVTPDQKLMLVKALKAKGHTVAMTGDGVNDVLALKEADCSIAMAAGSDAAKNVSSLVLMDSNFASMPKVVAEGRRSINNLERSASLFLVKTMYTLMFAIMFMIIDSELPFEPKHLTIIGVLTIGIPSFILALEPNKERIQGKFLSKVVATALPGSITVVLSVVAVLIASKFVVMETADLKQVYFILTAYVGYLYLFKVCMPINNMRAILFVALVGLFVLAFFATFDGFDLAAFFGMPDHITREMASVIFPMMIIDIPLFIGLHYLVRLIANKGVFDKMFVSL